MSRGGVVRGGRSLPGVSLALWHQQFVEDVVSYLVGQGARRDLVLLCPVQGGLTTFLTAQLGPAASGMARWLLLPLGRFAGLAADDPLEPILRWLAVELSAQRSLPEHGGGPLDCLVRELAQTAGETLLLCVDDGQDNPKLVRALCSFASALPNLRLVIGSHDPLPGPFTHMHLPSLTLDQVAAIIGPGYTPEQVETVAWWTGRRPPLVRDVAISLAGTAPGKSWSERLGAAVRTLCDQHDCHPYAARLRQAVRETDRRLLASLAQGSTSILDYRAAVALIRIGVLEMTKDGRLEFSSPIVKHWFLMESATDLCRVMTEKGSRVVPAEEANRLVEGGRKRGNSDPHFLLVDARPPACLWYRGAPVDVGDDVIVCLRILCESRAASPGRPVTVLYSTLEKAAPKSADPRQWAYGVKHKIVKALGMGVIELDRGAGFRLSDKIRFLWIEPLAA